MSPLTHSKPAFEEPDAALQYCSVRKRAPVELARVGDESGRQPGHAGGAAFPRALVSSQLQEGPAESLSGAESAASSDPGTQEQTR